MRLNIVDSYALKDASDVLLDQNNPCRMFTLHGYTELRHRLGGKEGGSYTKEDKNIVLLSDSTKVGGIISQIPPEWTSVMVPTDNLQVLRAGRGSGGRSTVRMTVALCTTVMQYVWGRKDLDVCVVTDDASALYFLVALKTRVKEVTVAFPDSSGRLRNLCGVNGLKFDDLSPTTPSPDRVRTPIVLHSVDE